MMTVLGLRTTGTEIGGMTIAMIGLRIGHGMMIRFGSLPIGYSAFALTQSHDDHAAEKYVLCIPFEMFTSASSTCAQVKICQNNDS